MDFTWNETDGYAIGFNHKHTVGTGPSPADVMSPAGHVNSSELRKSGQQQFYRDNLTVTTLSEGNTYIITIADWDAITKIHTEYLSIDSLNTQYQKLAKQYLIKNDSADKLLASEYALVKLFGSAVNLYKKASGTSYFVPYTVNKSNTIIQTPCK